MTDTPLHLKDPTLTIEDLTTKTRNSDVPRSLEKGWYEVKMTGKLPERRSYHVSCIYKDNLFVFGG